MAPVLIRKATPADAASLGNLHVLTWRETYTGLLPNKTLDGLSVGARTERWSRILDAPDEFGCVAVFVADGSDGSDGIIAFGSAGRQRDESLSAKGFTGEFNAIYVLRSYQGRGVGRAMMSAMSSELSAAGHTAASLWVLRENASARLFYEKLGGTVVGEKIEHRPEAAIVEDAYGWFDLSPLASV